MLVEITQIREDRWLCHLKWHYKGLSRVRGNQHARFLWERRPVTGAGLPGNPAAKITSCTFQILSLRVSKHSRKALLLCSNQIKARKGWRRKRWSRFKSLEQKGRLYIETTVSPVPKTKGFNLLNVFNIISNTK